MTNLQELRALQNIVPKMTTDQIVVIAAEELTELEQALGKFLRYKLDDPTLRKEFSLIFEDIKEEYCDVMLALFHLKNVFGITDEEIEKIIDEKLTRTEDILRGEDA